jgi:hypothetical protein
MARWRGRYGWEFEYRQNPIGVLSDAGMGCRDEFATKTKLQPNPRGVLKRYALTLSRHNQPRPP